MGFGENDLLTLAPGRLVNEASTGSTFDKPFAVVTLPAGMVLVRLPFTVMVTLSVNVHCPKGGRLPPLYEKELAPGTPLSVPPQVPTLKFRGLARIMPVPGMVSTGISSVKAIPVSVTLPGLTNSMLIVEAAPPVTINGSKPLLTAMDKVPLPVTVKFAERLPAGARFSVFVIFAGGIVLVYTAGVLLVTKTSILQRCPARIKPFVKEMEIAPVAALKTRGGAAPQPVIVGAVELLTVTPVGRLSVIEKFVRFVSLGAKISIRNLELPPAGIVAGENDFAPETSVPAMVTVAFARRGLPTP